MNFVLRSLLNLVSNLQSWDLWVEIVWDNMTSTILRNNHTSSPLYSNTIIDFIVKLIQVILWKWSYNLELRPDAGFIIFCERFALAQRNAYSPLQLIYRLTILIGVAVMLQMKHTSTLSFIYFKGISIRHRAKTYTINTKSKTFVWSTSIIYLMLVGEYPCRPYPLFAEHYVRFSGTK